MSLIIQHNMPLLNAQNKYKVNTGNRAKSTERLSSGYMINRAADDAAGLTISEKMRRQIRGLERGTLNGQDGVSWVQTGDGALNEVHAILHRMKELTVQSLNDTNTDEDRAALQAELNELQSEIDRITDTTQFNTKNIFADHEPTYYQYEGNVVWSQSQRHPITAGENELVIKYTKDENSPTETVTVSVPAGEYTTQELTDEIEDALIASGASEQGIVVEYTDAGTFNISLEGGEKIEEVTGDLAYLLYDTYKGGSVGALIGTTSFPSDLIDMPISLSNNYMEFDVEYFNGSTDKLSITLPVGGYTRPELIEEINSQLTGTGVEASAYGTGIKLASNDAIITGFKGNMFKIDESKKGETIYSSVFYDNVKYGSIYTDPAVFTGGAVMPQDGRDSEHQFFTIDSSNNQLTFTANGSTTPTTITIPEGEYTMQSMINTLNGLFTDASLDMEATSYSTSEYKNGRWVYYTGITITSGVEGATSKIGLDSSSSAYNTLFINRVYNNYKSDAVVTQDSKSNVDATFTGSQIHSGVDFPLTLTSTNNTFSLKLTSQTDAGTAEDTYTIAVDATTYNTLGELVDAIDEQLNGSNAGSGLKDKIAVSDVDGKIKLTAAASTRVTRIEVSAYNTNEGYDTIFEGEKSVKMDNDATSATTTGKPTVTLDNEISDPTTFTDDNNKLTVNINGNETTITFPTNQELSRDEILDIINGELEGYSYEVPNDFTAVERYGNTTSNEFAVSSTGYTYPNTKNYSDTGSTTYHQGTIVYDINEAASQTMTVAVPETMKIDSSNNSLNLTVNGEEVSVTLASGTYNRAQLVNEIQNKIDAKTGGNYDGNGVKVSIDNSNRLVFTCRLNISDGSTAPGASTSIAFGTGTSTFIKELHTTRTDVSVTTNALKDSIVITDDTNVFSFSYTENGVSKTADITLKNGTYSRQGFVDELKSKLEAQNINVKAELSGTKLKLTTANKGSGNSISYNIRNGGGGSCVEAVFGPRQNHTAATGLVEQTVQDKIVIDSDTDEFKITVNGTEHTLLLEHDEYNQTTFMNMLNEKLATIGMAANIESGKIRYTTVAKGITESFRIEYSNNPAMVAIYGVDEIVVPGAEASFNSNGQLVLTGTQNGGYISVDSDKGGAMQTPEYIEEPLATAYTTGYFSTTHSAIDGVNITEPVTIDEWNNDMSFTYYYDGGSSNVSIAFDNSKWGEYTFDELKTELQAQIDNQLGSGKLTVEVGASGVRIEAVDAGKKYYMSGFSGNFYHKVMCSTVESTETKSASEKSGKAPSDTAYTVGRKDVKNNAVDIKAGMNDTLSIDFQYGDETKTTTFEIVLDPGTYQGDSLVDMIQEKLNEAMVAQNFSEDMIIVGIGGINTGVYGSNDANALNFKLSDKVELPGEGQYIIDGVSGNAAFSVFYQTDGELVPAYVKGAKDISEGVTIEDGANDLSFDVEGVTYSITLTADEYTADEIIAHINEKLDEVDAPVEAEMEDGVLKISHTVLGERKIENVTGGAKQALFFKEYGEIGEEEGIKIQLSSEEGDYIVIERPVLNTVSLGINSIVITKPKYANKALNRIDEAVNMLSSIRSSMGAKQNRLEHAIANNRNAAENTQAAESRIRDLDMSEEMVKYSKDSILMQAAEAVMSHAMTDAEGVLRLLQ